MAIDFISMALEDVIIWGKQHAAIEITQDCFRILNDSGEKL